MHTVGYPAGLKKKAVLSHAVTWVNLKGVVLSETSQVQKDKYCTFPVIFI